LKPAVIYFLRVLASILKGLHFLRIFLIIPKPHRTDNILRTGTF
jgi:hypothetical protein